MSLIRIVFVVMAVVVLKMRFSSVDVAMPAHDSVKYARSYKAAENICTAMALVSCVVGMVYTFSAT